MSCRHLTKHARPASFLHRAFCAECRGSARPDSIISFGLLCRGAEPVPVEGMGRLLAALDLPYSVPRPRRERVSRFVRRVRRPVGILAGGSVLLGYAWTRYIDIEPDVVVPAATLQGPNAFDDFTSAASKLMEGKTIDEMQTQVAKQRKEARLAAEQGAAAVGNKQVQPPPPAAATGGMMSGGGTSAGGMGPAPAEHVYTLDEREEALRINKPALDAVRLGLTRRFLSPRIRSYNQTMPYLADFRKLARLLRLEADTYADRGEWFRSVMASIDAIDLGMHIRQNGPLMESLVGSACESIGRSGLWDGIEHLSAAEARQAARRLEKIEMGRFPAGDMMREEKWCMIAETMSLMRMPGWRTVSFTGDGQATNYWAYFALLPYSKKRIVSMVSQHMDNLVNDTGSPIWNQQASTSDGVYGDYPPVLQTFMPEFSQCKFREFVDQAQNKLLTVALALRAYKQEHGAYPLRLTQLMPNYLGAVPRDPFDYSNSLKYRQEGPRCVLWSVGPDSYNNQGDPIKNDASAGSSLNRAVTTSSQGDIVAGINTY